MLTSISGVSFPEAWKHRITTTTDIGDIHVLGLAQLRANKLAAGRPKDLLDLALLDEMALAKPAKPRKSKDTDTRRGKSSTRK